MSALSDPYGRVIAERRSGAQVGELVGQLPQALDASPLYVRIGDVFGWFSLLAWLAIAIAVRLRSTNGSTAIS